MMSLIAQQCTCLPRAQHWSFSCDGLTPLSRPYLKVRGAVLDSLGRKSVIQHLELPPICQGKIEILPEIIEGLSDLRVWNT
jgi:hypothetical protein